MIQNLFVHTITVIRFVELGQSNLGSPSYGSESFSFSSGSQPNVYEIPCRIEEQNAMTQYRESNDRKTNFTIMYLNPQYIILEKDRIYWASKHKPSVNSGDYVGVVVGVNPAMKANTTVLDHWEVIIENP